MGLRGHQDLSITGTDPVVEVFKNRVEITNPGAPLVSVNRILDNPPRSRNEIMAKLMRRLGICEELGTGWDRVATYCEKYINHEKATNATLRERFGLAKSASASASRLIALAVEQELIKPLDENTAPRYMSYIPIWA